MQKITFTKFTMPKIIAEIGCNHKGNIQIAKDMILVLKNYCNCEIVKFQKRDNNLLLSNEEFNRPHPEIHNSYGDTYGKHREYLEFNFNTHLNLKKEIEKKGMTYSTSVWDINSTKEIVKLNPNFIKIPSASNLNFQIHEYLSKKYKKEIHISLGMTTKKEVSEIVNYYKKINQLHRVVLYVCTSGYPVSANEICSFELYSLFKKYGKQVKGFGFSGHHLGISVDLLIFGIASLLEYQGLGRLLYIERHFTLDRTWKGTDHAASLEPEGLKKLIRDIKNAHSSLKFRPEELIKVEKAQRKKLKKIVRI